MKKFSILAVIAVLAGCFAFASVASAAEVESQVWKDLFLGCNSCGKSCGNKCDSCNKCSPCKTKCNSCHKCDTCKPKCNSCCEKPKCEPCCKPKCNSCCEKPKCNSCCEKPKCNSCCKPKCCPKPITDYPCPCTGDAAIGRPGMSRQQA